jgi:hypothetical protein
MFKAKRIVVATTLLVSFLLMMTPAFSQTRQKAKGRTGKRTTVASSAKPNTSTAASRMPARNHTAVREPQSLALDSNRISAGVSGQASLSAPKDPTTTAASKSLSAPSAPTITATSKSLSAPNSPNPIH